jgi:archaemetzincin
MNSKDRIILRALGSVPDGLFTHLSPRLQKMFPAELSVGSNGRVPRSAFDGQRNQFNAVVMLKILQGSRREEDELVLGVTEADLFVPRMNFVFGVAGGGAALVSLHRLRQEYFGLPADNSQLLRRALIESVHELGHVYGLDHCPEISCVMFFSNTLVDTDRKGSEFCPRCAALLPQGS